MSIKLRKVKQKAFKLGASNIEPSTRKNKKYMVEYKGNVIHFGQKGYKDFLDHNKDPIRRMSYRKRARGITNKEGQKTYKLKSSANFWAYNVLW